MQLQDAQGDFQAHALCFTGRPWFAALTTDCHTFSDGGGMIVF